MAAHISAASSGGKRYNPHLTSEERAGALNGIWLCQTCAHLIDTDEKSFPEELLHIWKKSSEGKTSLEIYGGEKKRKIAAGLFNAKLNIVPTQDNKAALALFTISNNDLKDLFVTAIEFEVVECFRNQPMGNARSSHIAELDIGEMTQYKEKRRLKIFRAIGPNQKDEFSVALAAPSLDGLFCAWKFNVRIQSTFGTIQLGEHEVFIPKSGKNPNYSLADIRRDLKNLIEKNEKGLKENGIGWLQRKKLFIRHFWKLRGYSFSYSSGMVHYSGPMNFLRNSRSSKN